MHLFSDTVLLTSFNAHSIANTQPKFIYQNLSIADLTDKGNITASIIKRDNDKFVM